MRGAFHLSVFIDVGNDFAGLLRRIAQFHQRLRHGVVDDFDYAAAHQFLVLHQREVRFDLKNYAHIDHGYAATIHKSQGVTVDHAHVLATDGLDRHAAYVGMSRHRESLAVHYGADDFKDREQLTRTLGRERAKDTTLDYGDLDHEQDQVTFAPSSW